MKPIDTFELPPVPSLVTSLDWRETVKQFARDSIRKYLAESGFDSHCSRSDAWGEVVAVLDEVAPGWRELKKGTGAACAVAAIRKLAADAARAPKEPLPFDLEAAMRGEPIVARDGRQARFIAYVPEAAQSGRVVAMIEGCELPLLYYEDGTCISRRPEAQLFMEP
jgi:hypothetical protein